MLYRLASHTHTRKRVLSKLATTRKTAEHSERGYHLHNDDNGEGGKKEAKSTVEEEEEEKTTGFFLFLLPLRHGTIERKISLSFSPFTHALKPGRRRHVLCSQQSSVVVVWI